jgi:hypothetical protein
MSRCRAWIRLKTGWIPRPVRRGIVVVIGGTVLLLAIAGMVLPILPGVIFLPLGLAILAVEFAWAARWLKKFKSTAKNVQQRVCRSKSTDAATTAPDAPGLALAAPCDAGLIARPKPPLVRPPRNAAA